VKKIFVISTVKNEGDIIESFCRYNLTYSDGMIIYENNKSSDNTREIIQKLIDEGLPIYLEEDEDLYYETVKKKLVNLAAFKYGADLVLPLDADEFLYHIDGKNPREILETLQEDTEYQAVWRTYIYEHEPDINLGFMPNNFSSYRNPEMENPNKYERHKKVIVSRFLIEEMDASICYGAHFLLYPENRQNDVKKDVCEKLVVAHFPVRSRAQVMKKVIPNWINKWPTHNYRQRRHVLDAFHLGFLFNGIRDSGEVSQQNLEQYSLEYAMMLDANTNDEITIMERDELDKIKSELGTSLKIPGMMNTDSLHDKLKLRYTEYSVDNKILMQSILKEVDTAVTFLSNETYDLLIARQELQHRVNELTGRVRELVEHTTHIEKHNDNLEKHVEDYRRQIAEIYSSKAWRVGSRLVKMFRFIIPKKR